MIFRLRRCLCLYRQGGIWLRIDLVSLFSRNRPKIYAGLLYKFDDPLLKELNSSSYLTRLGFIVLMTPVSNKVLSCSSYRR